MLDNHQIELVHADVDGELPAGQRGELSRLLLADPEARALHDDMRRLSGMLEALPGFEPPAGLDHAVLESIPWRAATRTKAPTVGWRHTLPRMAAAAAAGALLTATLYHLGSPFGADVDGSELSGTMASPAVPAAAPVLRLDLEQVKGTVAVTGTGAKRTIDFDVATAVPVDVVATAGGVENVYQLEASTGKVRRSFTLEGLPDNAVDLEFYSAGTSLGRARVGFQP